MSPRRCLSAVRSLGAATLLALGCREPFHPVDAGADAPRFAVTTTPLEVTGTGGIGSSVALPGMNRQEFDFSITSPPAGRFFIRDYSSLRTSTEVLASMTVEPADSATGITQFDQTSASCVAFGGIGRLDTGDLVAFTVQACDNGSPGAGLDFFSIAVPGLNYSKAASLADGDITITGETKGDLDVVTVTTGNDIDQDGYTVTLDSTASQAIGPDATVQFTTLPEGTYLVELSGLAAHCAVDSSSRTVSVTAGSVTSTTFEVSCAATSTTLTRVTGLGVIGTEPALPGMERFELDFDVSSDFTGRVRLTDYAITRSNGSPASMTVDPADPETFISSFSRTSATCVAFGGVGRLNDGNPGPLYQFFIDVCDNANPGAGADTFSVELPDRPYSKSATLTEGDIAITTITTS